MKFIVCGLFFLLGCTVLAWAQDLSFFDFQTDDKKYGLSLYKLNWFQAQHYCAAQKYTLANIPTYDSQSTLTTFIQGIDYDVASLIQEPIWTSGTNQGQSNANQFVWLSSGARISSYSNYETNTAGANRCIAINGVTGYWTKENCNDARYFLCEQSCETASGTTCVETDTNKC